MSFLSHSTWTARPATLVLWAAPARPVQQVFLAPCRLLLANDTRVLITTPGVWQARTLWCDSLVRMLVLRVRTTPIRRRAAPPAPATRVTRAPTAAPAPPAPPAPTRTSQVSCKSVDVLGARPSPKSLLAWSHVSRYHNSSVCWMCARGIVCIKVFSMYELMQGLHTCACSPSMDVCNAGMDISPCVLVLKIMTHQAPWYVNACKQAAAPAPTVRRASTR